MSKCKHPMSTRKHNMLVSAITCICLIIGGLAVSAYRMSLQSPPNAVWALFSGYYRYDPRHDIPPNDLFLDRPEVSLTYFLDATLKRCGGSYPPLSRAMVTHYDMEEVEYFGYTDYHALSDVHTRLYFVDGTSTRAVFRFEAGHNESYPLYVMDVSTIRAGSWMALGSLLRDPIILPPGWSSYDADPQPMICNPGPPYAIDTAP
jgi:hypothetical protein